MKGQAKTDWDHVADRMRHDPSLRDLLWSRTGRPPLWWSLQCVLHPIRTSTLVGGVFGLIFVFLGGWPVGLGVTLAVTAMSLPGAYFSRWSVASIVRDAHLQDIAEPISNVRRAEAPDC